MSRGFQPNPIAEHAHATILAARLTEWRDAEQSARVSARDALAEGCRAATVAAALGMSRATLYRWLAD